MITEFNSQILFTFDLHSKRIDLIKTRLQSIFLDVLKSIPEHSGRIDSHTLLSINREIDIKKLLETLSNDGITEDEALIMNALMKLLKPEEIIEALKGAHLRLRDNGVYYQKWSGLSSARDRVSSHPAKAGSIQYGIAGPLSHEILFGIVEEKGETYTFLQLENTPWGGELKNLLRHSIDTFHYFSSGRHKNIGPYGASCYTDSYPLLITTNFSLSKID